VVSLLLLRVLIQSYLPDFYEGLNVNGEVQNGVYNHLLNLRHSNPGSNHQLQIASSYVENDKLFFRKFARALGPNNPAWHEIATREGNTFNGNQTVNGRIFASMSSIEGGSLSLVNPSKSGVNAAREWAIFNMTGVYTNSLQFWSYGDNGYQSGPKLAISDNGNVGIGTATPSVTTHIEKSASGIVDILKIKNNYAGTSGLHGTSILLDGFYSQSKITSYENPTSTLGGNLQLQTYNGSGILNTGIMLNRLGKVGIGTINPDEMLTVNGTIHSTEVKVTQNVPADYVFQKYYTGKSELKLDYTFPTLAEIENFTKKNNHLPSVPSAKEMQEKGVSLGEMSNILLQKIEELTLYTIQQQKELELLKAENNIQSKKIETLEKENNTLKELYIRITEIENRINN
jgi:hypothetical protein